MDEDLPTDPYPFLCNNCGGQFKTHTAFLTHFSPKRHACAFADNVVVKNLKLFTAEAVASSLRKLTDLAPCNRGRSKTTDLRPTTYLALIDNYRPQSDTTNPGLI